MITFKDKDNILNPDRSIGEGVKTKDLKKYEFPQIVDFFRKRLVDFYFSPLENLIKKTKKKKKSNLGFILIAHCSMIIDTLSSYHHPNKVTVKDRIITFLQDNFQHGFEKLFKNQATSKYWNKKQNNSFQFIITSGSLKHLNVKGKPIAEVFYYAFRNSIVHNASILPFGGYIYNQPSLIDFSCWKPPSDGFELSINPVLLFMELKNYLKSYTKNLKNTSNHIYDQLRDNFKIKFRFDFGYAE
jgi:hypothetical protein